MSEQPLSGILVLLVPQLIQEIMKQGGVSENDATAALYRSDLYAALENERTKLWHLSPKALYVLYQQEQQTGHIDYPEEA